MVSYTELPQITIQGMFNAHLDIEHIMRLGGWESLDIVVRYTRSVRFEENLRVFRDLGK